MKNIAFYAAITGAVALSLTSAFAQATGKPPTSYQPNHQYTERMVPLKDVLQIKKRVICSMPLRTEFTLKPDGNTDEKKLEPGKVDPALCPSNGDMWTLYVSKSAFERVSKQHKDNNILPIMAETNIKDDPGSNERKCLDVPVKYSQAYLSSDNEVKISFMFDETAEMRRHRETYIPNLHPENRNLDVRCYNIRLEKVTMTMPAPPAPPQGEDKSPVEFLKNLINPKKPATAAPTNGLFFDAIEMFDLEDQSVACAKAAGRMLAIVAGGKKPELEPAIAKPLAMSAITESYKSVCVEYAFMA